MTNAIAIHVGDILTRPKFPGIPHEGVFAGNNQVCHNTPDEGEHISSVQEFAKGQPVKVQYTGANESKVLERMKHVVRSPQRYNLFLRNCQHTANGIVYGIARSPVVMTIIVLITVGMIIWLLGKCLKAR